jgi:hypothetical protein
MSDDPYKHKTRAELTCDERGVVRVKVTRLLRNPRLAECTALEGEQEGKRILVDVRRCSLFHPGMEIEAHRARGGGRFAWEYRGPLPRWRGDRHLGAPQRFGGPQAVRGIRRGDQTVHGRMAAISTRSSAHGRKILGTR